MPSKRPQAVLRSVTVGFALVALTVPPALTQTLYTPGITTTVQPSLGSTQADPYTLGAGDQVRIDIFRVPQYSGETEVLVDGTLNLPLVGTVPVDGLTIEAATAAVSTAYSNFLRRPVVTITLLSRRATQIGVAGEVQRPGSYAADLTNVQYPTLTQLLTAAGGITLSADLETVEVRRPQSNGYEQVIKVNLWQLVETGDLRYDVALRDGDSVFVPTIQAIDLKKIAQLADTSFAADIKQPVNVAVNGQVFRQGSWTVAGIARTAEAGTPGSSTATGVPTVTRALQVAGGIKPLADIQRVEIRRPTRTGDDLVFEVNLWSLLQEGDLDQDTILQAGDTISVPTAQSLDLATAIEQGSASFSPDQIQVNVVGEVENPGVVALPPNTPLDKAILAAGGFNRRANKGSVDLVRLNPDGSGSRQRLDVDFSQGIGETNPPLQNNDVIIVRRSGVASFSDTLGTVLSPIGGLFSLFDIPRRIFDLFD